MKCNEKELKYFQCFSMPLKQFLDSKGVLSEFKAKHCKTDKVFYLYLYDKDGKLNKALLEWDATKPKFWEVR
jgi:hypothetical protein